MKKEFWNKKEIISRIKYVRNRLKVTTDDNEKRSLIISLLSYYEMIGIWFNTKIKLFNIEIGDYLIDKDMILNKFKNELIYIHNDCYDIQYISYLFDLVLTVYNEFPWNNIKKEENEQVDNEYFSNSNIIFIVKYFYKCLDNEFSNMANVILDDNNHYVTFEEVSKATFNENYAIYGITYIDPSYRDAFIVCFRQNSITDIFTLTHEVMHGIAANYSDWDNIERNHVFYEIPPLVIEMLLADYLERNKFSNEEIEKLKMNSIYELKLKICNIIKIITKFEKNEKNNYLIDIDNIDDNIYLDLLYVESYIVAYGLYKQIIEDKDNGIENLKLLMKNNLSLDKNPNFDLNGLDNNKLLELAKEIGINISNVNKCKSMVRKK